MATSAPRGRVRSTSKAPFAPGQLTHLASAPAPRSALALVGHARSVLADSARADSGPRRLRSAWDLLVTAAPELADWSIYFAAGAAQREAIEAGAANVVTSREADDLLRAAYEFLRAVESSLGLLIEPVAS